MALFLFDRHILPPVSCASFFIEVLRNSEWSTNPSLIGPAFPICLPIAQQGETLARISVLGGHGHKLSEALLIVGAKGQGQRRSTDFAIVKYPPTDKARA